MNIEHEDSLMKTTIRDLKKEFALKVPDLEKGLRDWFEEESASIDGSVEAGAPAGDGGSIISGLPAIDSKRVIDATLITEEVLGIELPPEIIKPGGYETFDEMINDIIPKLEQVYSGELKVKKRKQPQKTKEEVA